ncbi:cell wall-binding repeat-containing protein [Euzebya sp.]|uniref:cell wall-binding repeat-containing protein n=1 Tax=Euzebya sp. TaxID=1971409 RepID=UPI003518428A
MSVPLPLPSRALRAALVVALTAASLVVGLVPAASAQDAPAPSTDYQQVVDMTFPTRPDVSFGDSYDACRSGCSRRHKATDLMGPKLTPLYAAVEGRICHVAGEDGVEPGYGYAVTVCGVDGREYRYLHINNDTPGTDDGRGGPRWAFAPGIRRGVEVRRGQFIAYMGDSGNAEGTGPHLHLDIFDDRVVDPYGDTRINPYPSLVAARTRGDVSTDPGVPLDGVARQAGSDRLATAIQLSTASWGAAPRVVLSTAHQPGWPLVASSYAAHLDVPSLLTFPDALDPRVLAEIARLGATEVTLVGPAQPPVIAALEGAGLSVDLVVSDDLPRVAVTLAQRIWADTDTDVAVIALGTHPDPARSWPDALTGSALAAGASGALLPVAPGQVPGAVDEALAGADRAVLVGGLAALDEAVEAAVARHVGHVDRLQGPDRYATATAVVDFMVDRGMVALDGWIWAATGLDWPDAVTAGPVAVRSGDPLVLIDGTGAPGDGNAIRWIRRHAGQLTSGMLVGGPAAISDHAASELRVHLT